MNDPQTDPTVPPWLSEVPGGADATKVYDASTAAARADMADRAKEEPIVRFFAYAHLPPHLQTVSKPFGDLALHLLTIPRCAERTVALRKLLEAKDAAVRANLT